VVAGGPPPLPSAARLEPELLAALRTWLGREPGAVVVLLGEQTALANLPVLAIEVRAAGPGPEPGTALGVDFNPTSTRPVPLPPGLSWVLARSQAATEAPASVRAELVVGARIAAAMLADQVGVEAGHPPGLDQVAAIDVVELLAEDLPERISAEEAAHGAEVPVEELVRLRSDRWDPKAKVPVKRVARHLLSEAARVTAAEAALAAGELAAFGELMDESHNSLRQDLRCSTPALDHLCAAMRKAGAFGAKQSGDEGWALGVAAPERVIAVIGAAEAAGAAPAFQVWATTGLANM
jgi:galactokinase